MTVDAYRTLRDELLACRLLPGTRLKMSALGKTYGFSLGAVREALSRLSSEGFVVAEPQRGFTAAPLSTDDLRDLVQARVEIDSICIQKSIEEGDLEWETQLVAATHRLEGYSYDRGAEPLAWQEAHSSFHTALLAGCGNRTLLEVHNNLFARSERYRLMSLATPSGEKRAKEAAREHRLLFEAAMARDSASAAEMVRQHIGSTSRALLESLSGEKQ